MTASSRRSGASSIWTQLRSRAGALIRLWVDLFSRHQILNSASAISFQSLKALVPHALFGLALLRLLSAAGVWRNTLAAGAHHDLTPTAFIALDTAVEKILMNGDQRCQPSEARRCSGMARASCARA